MTTGVSNHAALIWSVAELLRGNYKQSEYGKEWTVLKYDGDRLTDGQHAAVVGLIRNLQGLLPDPDQEE